MKRIFFIFFVAILTLNSCSSSGDTTPEVNPSDVLLKRTITNSDGFITESFYEYNGKKFSGYHNSWGNTRSYTYTSELITQIKWYDIPSQNNQLLQTVNFEYNNDGTLKKITRNFLDEDFDRVEFTYISNNEISYEAYLDVNNEPNNLALIKTGSIHLNNGLITNVVTNYVNSGNTTSVDYHYDGKNNPLKNVVGYDKIILFSIFYSGDDGFSHNVGTTQNFTYSFSNRLWEYQYNDLEFPSKSVYEHDNLIIDYFYE